MPVTKWIFALTLLSTFAVGQPCSTFTFRDHGRAYALTSSSPHCSLSSHLVRSDWAWGLALYEAPETAAPELGSLTLGTEGVVTLRGQETLGGGRILSRKSHRNAIAGLSHTIELQGIEIGPTMIGAPAFSSNGHFIGVVSHQYLQTHPGAPTRVADWDDSPSHRESHLILIPATAVLEWLAKPPATRFRQNSDGRLQADGLTFQLQCPKSANNTGPEEPIGGSDGVGIGGDSPRMPACAVEMSSGKLALFFLDQNHERVSFFHLGEFARYYLDSHLTLVTAAAPTTELAKLGLTIAESVKKIFAERHEPLAERDGLLRKLYLVGQVLASEQFSQFSKSEVLSLADPNHEFQWAWINFRNANKTVADDVASCLLRAGQWLR